MSIFPSNPQINDEFSGKRWNGTAWEVIGINLSRDYTLENEFDSHTSASTVVHGILNTSALATQENVSSASAAAVSSANSYTDSASASIISISESYSDSVSASVLSLSNSYADSAVSGIINSAPESLNTLNELAAALGDDSNFATTVTNSLSEKLDASSASTIYATISYVEEKSFNSFLLMGS